MNNCRILILYFYFFILYLSFQNACKCIKIENPPNKLNRNNVRFKSKNNNLPSNWGNNHSYNFLNLLKEGYFKNKGDLDDIKDQLADELADKIQNKITDFLKDEKELVGTEFITNEDLDDLKKYVKDVSEYVGLKAADLLDKNLEEALKPILTKKEFDNFEDALKNKKVDNWESIEEAEVPRDINKEAENFVDELVEDYEGKNLDTLNQGEKEVKAHNVLD